VDRNWWGFPAVLRWVGGAVFLFPQEVILKKGKRRLLPVNRKPRTKKGKK